MSTVWEVYGLDLEIVGRLSTLFSCVEIAACANLCYLLPGYCSFAAAAAAGGSRGMTSYTVLLPIFHSPHWSTLIGRYVLTAVGSSRQQQAARQQAS